MMITDINWAEVAKAVKRAGFTEFGWPTRKARQAVDMVPMKGFKEVATCDEIIRKAIEVEQTGRRCDNPLFLCSDPKCDRCPDRQAKMAIDDKAYRQRMGWPEKAEPPKDPRARTG